VARNVVPGVSVAIKGGLSMAHTIVWMTHHASGGNAPQPEETCTDVETLRARVDALARNIATSFLAVRDEDTGQTLTPGAMRLLTGYEPIYRGSGYEPIKTG
jgi:hypothetical protein